jgi:hypothetical protein
MSAWLFWFAWGPCWHVPKLSRCVWFTKQNTVPCEDSRSPIDRFFWRKRKNIGHLHDDIVPRCRCNFDLSTDLAEIHTGDLHPDIDNISHLGRKHPPQNSRDNPIDLSVRFDRTDRLNDSWLGFKNRETTDQRIWKDLKSIYDRVPNRSKKSIVLRTTSNWSSEDRDGCRFGSRVGVSIPGSRCLCILVILRQTFITLMSK